MIVTLTFSGNATGKDRLVLPSEWGGQQNLYENIVNLVPVSSQTTIDETPLPFVKQISYPPNQEVTIRYELAPDRIMQVLPGRSYYRPIVQPEYFHLIGDTFLIHPQWDLKTKFKATLRWENLPAAWSLANSFGANQTKQTLKLTLYELKFAIYVGGDFRLTKKILKGKTVYVAIRDQWAFSDAELSDMVAGTVLAEREFWNDHRDPYFLVTLISSGQNEGHYAGTSFINSFALFLTSKSGINAPLKHLVAHEFFHNWNGGKLVRQAPEELVFWFSEGFTEYFARLLNVRSGVISLNEYVAGLNRVLYDYHTSAVKEMSNQEIMGQFWNNPSVSHLPYFKGELLALNWDAAIRQRPGGHNLAQAMLSLYRRDKSALISTQSLANHFQKYLAGSVQDEIERYIDEGEQIVPLANHLGACITLGYHDVGKNRQIPQYEIDQTKAVQNPSACLEYFQ